MANISISKKEYERLVDVKLRYDYLRSVIKDDLFASPPTRGAKKVVASFHKTGKYNRRFLQGLEKGLKRSSHFKA